MDLSKSYEFFKPEMLKERVHIIGCGSVGSSIAELLARFGITKITLYDFDTVEPHNIANQIFTGEDVGKLKVDAVAELLRKINPEIKANDLKLVKEGWNGQNLSGYVFLAVDSIELRKEIAESNRRNSYIKAMFDFRTRLIDAQHYAADWMDRRAVENFINTMDFSHDEAKEETPVSACNVVLSVAPTVRIITALGVSNFINFVKDSELMKMIIVDAFNFQITAI